MGVILKSGREVDNSCPFSQDCYADGFCAAPQCPESNYQVLEKTAELEHELGLLPHTDPDVQSVCPKEVNYEVDQV